MKSGFQIKNLHIFYVTFFVVSVIIALNLNSNIFYEKPSLERFEFYSDITSYERGLRYDKCVMAPIDNSLTSNSTFYFSCFSKQLEALPKELEGFGVVGAGNKYIENIVPFSEEHLLNDFPDYVIIFPFEVVDFGKSFLQKTQAVNSTFANTVPIETPKTPMGWLGENSRAIILEHQTSPRLYQFVIRADKIFKHISYEEWELSFFYSDDDLFYTYNKEKWFMFRSNPPNQIDLEIAIPKKFEILDAEKYTITTGPRLSFKESITTVMSSVSKEKPFTLKVVNTESKNEKIIINLLLLPNIWSLVDILRKRIIKNSKA